MNNHEIVYLGQTTINGVTHDVGMVGEVVYLRIGKQIVEYTPDDAGYDYYSSLAEQMIADKILDHVQEVG